MRRLAIPLLGAILLLPGAAAWTAGPDRPHHADLADLAAARLPPELRALVEAHREEFRQGALDPDGVTDPDAAIHTFYHTYETHDGGGGGVYQVELALHEATMALREGAPPEEVAYRLGVLTHFVLDLAVPFHTGADLYDHESHEAFEFAAYDHRAEYAIDASGREPQEVADVSAYAKDLAARSAAMAEPLVAALDAAEGGWSPEAREIAARSANMGIEATADLLFTAFARAAPERDAPSLDVEMPVPRDAEDLGLSLQELARKNPAALYGIAGGAMLLLAGGYYAFRHFSATRRGTL